MLLGGKAESDAKSGEEIIKDLVKDGAITFK